MTEAELQELIVELQHTIRGLRHDLTGHEATIRNWKEMYYKEKERYVERVFNSPWGTLYERAS